MIVVADFKTGRLEFLCGGVEGVGDRLPSVGTRLGLGAGHDNVLRSRA